MARIRYIKPGFFTNEALADCQPLARLLFSGLWVIADREGRLEDRPRKIKIEILPYDDCDISALITELETARLLTRYEVGGNRFIQITNFVKHQNPHPKEPASTIPSIDGHLTASPTTEKDSKPVAEQEENKEENESPITENEKKCLNMEKNVLPSLATDEKCRDWNGNFNGNGNGDLNTSPKGESEKTRARDPVGFWSKSESVQMYRRKFLPEKIPPLQVQEQIESIATDLILWANVLSFWEANGYRPESVGKMLDRYREQTVKAQTETKKHPGKAQRI